MINLIKKLFEFFNYRIINKKKADRFNLENTLAFLIRKIDTKKFIFFDVGADVGTFSIFFEKILKKNNINNFEFHLFEPNQASYNELKNKFQKPNYLINNFALGASIETKDFYNTKDSVMSSFIKFDKRFEEQYSSKETKVEKTKIITLDKYIQENNIQMIDFLKIDTQCYNEKVLKGGANSLRDNIVKVVYSEIMLGKTYVESESFYNMEIYLKDNYSLFGVDVGKQARNIQVVSKNFSKELLLDLIYTCNKYFKF